RRQDMPLRLEHITAARVGWGPKSESLRSLAEQLRLGLDALIFLDDDPSECAEVQVNCPEVLGLPLPADPRRLSALLGHLRPFDRLRVVEEDRSRGRFYRQEAHRERLRSQALTLADFLANLRLEVRLVPLEEEHLRRAWELVQRTNQMNFTTLRRSES